MSNDQMISHRTIHIMTPETHIAVLADAFVVTTPWASRRYSYPTTAQAAEDFIYEFRFNVDLDARSLNWFRDELRRRARTSEGVSQ